MAGSNPGFPLLNPPRRDRPLNRIFYSTAGAEDFARGFEKQFNFLMENHTKAMIDVTKEAMVTRDTVFQSVNSTLVNFADKLDKLISILAPDSHSQYMTSWSPVPSMAWEQSLT